MSGRGGRMTCFGAVLSLALWGGFVHAAKQKLPPRPSAAIHKVIVVCLQGDQESNRRVESSVVPRLKRQGLDATASGSAFTAIAILSPQALLGQMKKSRADGIMLVTYSGEIPNEGSPKGIRFKYYSIKGASPKLSSKKAPLDEALRGLLQGLGWMSGEKRP